MLTIATDIEKITQRLEVGLLNLNISCGWSGVAEYILAHTQSIQKAAKLLGVNILTNPFLITSLASILILNETWLLYVYSTLDISADIS